MTSPSEDIFANAVEEGRGGVREVMMTFAVEVGERWIVRGCTCCAWIDGEALYDGLGRART